MFLRISLFCAAAAALSCVPYPGEPPVETGSTIIQGSFAPLDAGAYELASLHFQVKAYGGEAARQVADLSEELYNRIMVDTNLFSFRPRGLYQLVVYADQSEYRRKTGQPDWSGAATVGNAIYAYPGPHLKRTLAHEMTHLIFYEYMGFMNLDHRWVSEGLAVYEENQAAEGSGSSGIFSDLRGRLRQQPFPMEQFIHLVPATERERTVSSWYAQAESMVRFMIERGGKIGFSQFLAALRESRSFDQAVAEGYPGVWRSLADLEAAWRRSL
ncbi:MAG: hypothetical protein HY921_04870 [Elusimicrobia bacterium]|nr:hypothetical protein [Elusimicrobiota bacterium]